MERKKIIIFSGRTGGHITPALSIANSLKEYDVILVLPKRKAVFNFLKKYKGEILFVYDFKFKLKYSHFLVLNFIILFKIFLKNKLSLVISTGGFLTLYSAIFSLIFRIPFFIHEQNCLLGKAVKLFYVFSKKVFMGFDFKKLKNSIYTGNPFIYPEKKLEKKEAREVLGLDKGKRTILFLGGSQGASFLNNLFLRIEKKLGVYQIIVIWGENSFPSDIEVSKFKERKRFIFKFRSDMELIYQAADFAISRSGALVLTELAYYRIPAILIPFPYAYMNHQLINALYFKKITGVPVIEERKIEDEDVINKIKFLEEEEHNIKERMNGFIFEEGIDIIREEIRVKSKEVSL